MDDRMQEPHPLRAHMVLCLLGFRGSGYSPHFVSAMGALKRTLQEDPTQLVVLIDRPDRLCAVCPNVASLSPAPDLRPAAPHPPGRTSLGCILGGPNHEAHVRAQDTMVLQRLGLQVDGVHTWGAILKRVRMRIGPGDLPGICTSCPWLPLGICRESLEELRRPAAPLSHPAAQPGASPPGGPRDGR